MAQVKQKDTMIIDVAPYIDLYIHYSSANAAQEAVSANTIFTQRYEEGLAALPGQAIQAQADAIVAGMQANGRGVASALDIANALENGNLLENTLDRIAGQINSYLDQEFANADFGAVMSNVTNLRGMLANGPASAQDVQAFFDNLYAGLSMLRQYGAVDANLIAQLSNVASRLSGGSYSLSQDWNGLVISGGDTQIASRIARYLTNAANRLSKNGSVSANSFGGTIANAFNTAIGEPLSRIMVQQSLDNIVVETDGVFDGAISRSGGQLRWSGGTVSEAGQRRTTANRVAKVDLVSGGVFELSGEVNGQDLNIEIASNVSVKWGGGTRETIQIVNSTNLSQLLGEDTDARRAAYNMIVHRSAYPEAFSAVQAGVSISFFNNWLTGSGLAFRNGAGIDRAQFIMYNGRLYSVMTIIRNICDELSRQGTDREGVMNLRIGSVENKWQGEEGAKNVPMALRRSRLTQAVIEKLRVSCSLNSNMLSAYAHN